MGSARASKVDFRDGRSFKEVLTGLHKSQNENDKEVIMLRKTLGKDDDKECRNLDKKCLEGMVWRLMKKSSTLPIWRR